MSEIFLRVRKFTCINSSRKIGESNSPHVAGVSRGELGLKAALRAIYQKTAIEI
jgi:hypothetical protein